MSKEKIVIVIDCKYIIVSIAIVSLVVVFISLKDFIGPNLILFLERTEYLPGDQVIIKGKATKSSFLIFTMEATYELVAIEVKGEKEILWVDQVKTDGSGYFISSFILREDVEPGIYYVYASFWLAKSHINFFVRS